MLVAMGLAASLCIFLAFPWGGYQMLYDLLPYEADYKPYTVDHVVFQLQLLFAAITAFCILKKSGLYPAEKRSEILDFDWFYRKCGLYIVKSINRAWSSIDGKLSSATEDVSNSVNRCLYGVFSPIGGFSKTAPSGLAAVMTAAMLILVLVLVYFVR
jgi:multicomponent Na+:H+ antiporter subunit D